MIPSNVQSMLSVSKTSRISRRYAGWMGTLLALLSLPAFAVYPLEIQEVGPGIYALVGELNQRSPDNYANNSTHGVIITDEGVVLVDSGGSYQGAKQIHEAIKTLTDKPVKLVINTGGQDHRWLGNGYFKEHGATIITSDAALEDQHQRADSLMSRLSELIGKTLDGTNPSYADETFQSEKQIQFGGINIELHHVGAGHTVGDSFVWLPEQKIMFSGDIVFTERALGTGPAKNVKSWIKVFEAMAAYQPKIVVPGHGHATDLATATRDTHDYLVFLVEKIGMMLEEGVDLQDATNLDQSKFSDLEVFTDISRKNAQAVYEQLEFDSF